MRNITIGYSHDKYPKNIIRNQRYRWYTFPFLVFGQQFRYFFNIYFFAISFSQLFSRYSVSPLISNILPWTIVICVSLFREGVDDYKRYKRDMEANSQLYTVVRKVGKMPNKTETKTETSSESHILNMKSYEMKDIPSSEICVGDIIILSKNRRVPADCVLLSAPDNTIFIRTDQLDGETDWKSKIPVFQNIPNDVLFSKNCTLDADSPHKDIYSFVGTITDEITLALDYQNVLWMDTVLASNQAICVCIYTGSETRAVMNTMTPKAKLGLIDEELNFYSKFLLALSFSAAIVFTLMRGVVHRIDATVIRFLVIFSSVVPISLKVSIDGARYVYTYFIQKDIDCVVRNSSIPEELGRISYLLSDKTGTLTCNEMEMKKVHIGTLCYTSEMKDEIQTLMHKKICNDNRSYDSGGVHDSHALSSKSHPNNESGIVTNSQEKSNITSDIEKTGSMTESEMQSGKETMQSDFVSQQESMMSDYAKGRDSNDERKRDSLQTNYASEQESHIANSEQETWNSEQKSRNDNEESQNDNSETWDDNSEMNNSKQESDNNATNDSADFMTCNNSSVPSSYESCSGNGSKENLQIKDGMAINTKAYVESECNSTSNNHTEEDLVIPSSINEKYLKSENTCNSCSREDNLLSSAATNSTCQNSSEVPSSAHETARNTSKKKKKDLKNRVYDLLIGLSLCHNVTPVIDNGTTTYQASSPDEVAIVKWTESVGIKLIERSAHKIVLWNVGGIQEYKILHIFPFTSDSKRMGIVIEHPDKEIYFYQKGADVVMKRIVKSNDWLEEETDNMAREGLRTLIIGSKRLNSEEYDHFCEIYTKASNCIEKRSEEQAKAVSYLENDLNILGLTGVEDKLQDGVKQSLENLRNAGIKVWMLTGDKIETATCIAISSKLFSKTGSIKLAENIERREDAYMVLQDLQCNDYDSELKTKFNYLIVDGKSIQTFMQEFPTQFIKSASYLDAVVFCRCSPTQKADIALLLRKVSKKKVACIGDGGNDVSMITAADVGIGIVGKEGKQASLAADFSLERFKDVCTLFLWHGKNCYKGTAKLANLIIHRGTIISVMQAIFCSLLEFSPFTLYQGTIIVLYVTLYTFLPVFASIFSTDTTKETVYKFPELYRELNKSRKLSFRAFATWNVISFYQGAMIILLSCVFFKRELFSIISITFSSLIVNELLMVILSVDRVTKYLVIAEVLSLFFYVMSFVILKDELIMPCDLFTFLWKVGIINLAAISFTVVQKIYNKLISPSSTAKLTIE